MPLFDSNLSWLVDVDFYYRILRNRKIIFSENLYIKSETGHKYSLSYRIKKNIKSLDKEYIKKKYNFTFLIKVFLFFEIFIWIMIRILNSFSKKNDNN